MTGSLAAVAAWMHGAAAGGGSSHSHSSSHSGSHGGGAGGLVLPHEDPATKLAAQLCGQSLSHAFALRPLDQRFVRTALPTVMLEIAAGSGDAAAVVGAYLSPDAPAVLSAAATTAGVATSHQAVVGAIVSDAQALDAVVQARRSHDAVAVARRALDAAMGADTGGDGPDAAPAEGVDPRQLRLLETLARKMIESR